jgi:hypothetical protein
MPAYAFYVLYYYGTDWHLVAMTPIKDLVQGKDGRLTVYTIPDEEDITVDKLLSPNSLVTDTDNVIELDCVFKVEFPKKDKNFFRVIITQKQRSKDIVIFDGSWDKPKKKWGHIKVRDKKTLSNILSDLLSAIENRSRILDMLEEFAREDRQLTKRDWGKVVQYEKAGWDALAGYLTLLGMCMG